VPAAKQAWIIVVGTSLPVWSGESFGTVTDLPSTLTVNVSTGGGASLEMLEGKKFESVAILDEK